MNSGIEKNTEAFDKNAGRGRVMLSQIKNLWANDLLPNINVGVSRQSLSSHDDLAVSLCN